MGDTHQSIPSLLATGPLAEHRLHSPFFVPCSQGPIENRPGTKRCPALPRLQERSREPSEAPCLEQGHSSRSCNPSTGKATSYPSPCSLCSPRARDSLAQQRPRPEAVLHVRGDATQGKPTCSRTKPPSREMQSAQHRGQLPWMGESTPKWQSCNKTNWQTYHSFTTVPEDPFYQVSPSRCFTSVCLRDPTSTVRSE